MKSHSSFCSKFIGLFFVYLPTILIFSLMISVYVLYFFAYIYLLIYPDNNNFQLYLFFYTTDVESGIKRGYIQIAVVSFFFLLCLLSLFRVICMDPGFIPDPLHFEYELLLSYSNIVKNKGLAKFFSNFDEIVSENPLTETDSLQLNEAVYTLFSQSYSQIDLNENNINNNDIFKKQTDNLNSIKKYNGMDLTKIPLCSSCFRMKCERSHHCRQCGKCVKKMDHHCPWLATCIGFRNYKYFLLTHFHGIIATSIVFLTLFEALINYSLNKDTSLLLLISIFFCWICNSGLMAFLIWLCTANWGLMFKGETVIESLDKERFPGAHITNIYDLGVYRNFTTVFGNNPLVWFLPFFANYEGDGIRFKTNADI